MKNARDLNPQKAKENPLLLILLGMFMGFSASIPGISPAAIPFLFSAYEDLLTSLNTDFFKNFLRGRFREAFKKLQIRLFLPVALGIAFSIAVFFHLLSFVLEGAIARIYIYSFFLGVVFASARVIQKKILVWKASQFLFLIMGALFAVLALPGVIQEGLLFPFTQYRDIFSGLIFVTAFLLPGFSYFSFISDFTFSIPFLIIGSIIGWFLLSRFFSFLLKNYRERTLSFFLGHLLGSVPLIWPFGPYIHHRFVDPAQSFSLHNQQLIVCFLSILASYTFFLWFYRWQKRAKKELFIPE